MTTLCRSDWIEAIGEQELRQAKIDLLKLPTSSFEKMTASVLSGAGIDSGFTTHFAENTQQDYTV